MYNLFYLRELVRFSIENSKTITISNAANAEYPDNAVIIRSASAKYIWISFCIYDVWMHNKNARPNAISGDKKNGCDATKIKCVNPRLNASHLYDLTQWAGRLVAGITNVYSVLSSFTIAVRACCAALRSMHHSIVPVLQSREGYSPKLFIFVDHSLKYSFYFIRTYTRGGTCAHPQSVVLAWDFCICQSARSHMFWTHNETTRKKNGNEFSDVRWSLSIIMMLSSLFFFLASCFFGRNR